MVLIKTIMNRMLNQISILFIIILMGPGLDYPWSMAFLADNRLLVTELPGRLNILDVDSGDVTEVSDSGDGTLYRIEPFEN